MVNRIKFPFVVISGHGYLNSRWSLHLARFFVLVGLWMRVDGSFVLVGMYMRDESFSFPLSCLVPPFSSFIILHVYLRFSWVFLFLLLLYSALWPTKKTNTNQNIKLAVISHKM